MNSRPLVILGFVIILIAGIAAVGYVQHNQNIPTIANQPQDNTAGNIPDTTSSTFYDSTTTPTRPPVKTGSTTLDIPFPGQSAKNIDTTSWLSTTDSKQGYSIKYPEDLVSSKDGDSLVLALPKNDYFTWPLLDDVKVTISKTPHSCPDVTNKGPYDPQPSQFALNGYLYTRHITTDVGAGQLYTEIIYDLQSGGSCYRIDMLDHDTNGAGFYVDDTYLIKKYDSEHASNMAAMIGVLNAMVSSFRILAQTP